MKLGEGKIHKTCAIRCILGGTPPVMKTKINDGENKYYILQGEKVEKINHQLLDKVAENFSVKGIVTHLHGWNYLYLNSQSIALIE